MSKMVLLARPHPFIVNEMKPMLEQSGYRVSKPSSLDGVGGMVNESAAAVISLALVSDMTESAEEVLGVMLRKKPTLPIVFASMLAFDRAVPAISQMAKHMGINAKVIGITSPAKVTAGTDSNKTFFYLSKDNLSDPTLRNQVQLLLKSYIG